MARRPAEWTTAPDGEILPWLQSAAVHEWFLDSSLGGVSWTPPLTVVTEMALQILRARSASDTSQKRLVWIGRSCWPTFQMLAASSEGNALLNRCVFLDPLTQAEKIWSVAEALRCHAVGVVIADGAGIDATASRRLQLAAETQSARAFITRLLQERDSSSWAQTQWVVRPEASEGSRMQWGIPSIDKLWRLSSMRVSTLHALAEADAFASMGLTRQTALWAIQKLRDDNLPMFDGVETIEQEVILPDVPEQRLVVYDYAATGPSLKAHPISFVRNRLHQMRVTQNCDLANEAKCKKGQIITVAGLVLVRQRPGTASGVIFATLEDETGVANLVIMPNIYEQFRQALRHSVSLVARGRFEREGLVIHVNVNWAEDLQKIVTADMVAARSRDFH